MVVGGVGGRAVVVVFEVLSMVVGGLLVGMRGGIGW